MPTLETTIRPTFARVKDRFVLTGIEAEQNPKGQAANAQQFLFKIEYREVQGLELPTIVNMKHRDGSSIHLMFTNCQAKKNVTPAARDETVTSWPTP